MCAVVLYLPINKTWIISTAARRVYFACALAAFALFGVLIASRAAMNASAATSLAASPLAALVVRFLLLPTIFGAALLTVAMWYFWFGFDNSSWLRKAIWFLPLYFLLALGPAFYYFFVYRRSPVIQRSMQGPGL
jgi:hypothetical protein